MFLFLKIWLVKRGINFTGLVWIMNFALKEMDLSVSLNLGLIRISVKKIKNHAIKTLYFQIRFQFLNKYLRATVMNEVTACIYDFF